LAKNAVGAEGAANGQRGLHWPFSMASFWTRGFTVDFFFDEAEKKILFRLCFFGGGAMMVLANVFLVVSPSSVLREAQNMVARLRPDFMTGKAVSSSLQFCLERECYPQAKQWTRIICHQSPRLR